jgi:hypothetical protein
MVEKPKGLRYITFRNQQIFAPFQATRNKHSYNVAAFLQKYKSLSGFLFWTFYYLTLQAEGMK